MKYKKKPVIVEAIQWDGSYESTRQVCEFMGRTVANNEMTQRKFEEYVYSCVNNGMYIHTLEGQMKASIGDYIIKGVNGEIYPCKPDIFKKTYEKVEDF